MTEFIDIGVLWKGRKKAVATGAIDLKDLDDAMQKLDRVVPSADRLKVIIMQTNSQKDRAPDFRITAIVGEDDDRGGRRGGGRRDDRRRDEQTSRERARDDDRDRRQDRRDDRREEDVPF